ncbi:MAG: squalene/phytoene synthase family protein [Enterobacteriaceae bacterium PSpyr]|nr:MAG: squalene/phytoene synthase family protein [Enterobacteriaceae bacterium PSpyr]
MLNDIKKGSLNFSFSSFFLNKVIKKNILILYSWCRYCDDITDNEILGFKKKKFNIKNKILNIHNFILNTKKIYCNLNIKEYHFNNFKKIIYKYNISSIYIFYHIKGYLIDLKKKKHNIFKDILNYCYFIAGVIGIIIINIFIKNFNYNLLNNACNLGIAFQLTNISRDIIIDYKNKRCYLPNYLFNQFNLNNFNYFKKKNRKYLYMIIKKIINKSKLYYNLSFNSLYMLPVKLSLPILISYKLYNKICIKIFLNKKKSWNKRQKNSLIEKILILIDVLIKLLYNKIKNIKYL